MGFSVLLKGITTAVFILSGHCELFITAHLTLYFSIDLLRNCAVIYCSEQTPHATYQYANLAVAFSSRAFACLKCSLAPQKHWMEGWMYYKRPLNMFAVFPAHQGRDQNLWVETGWYYCPETWARPPGSLVLTCSSPSATDCHPNRRPHRPLALRFCQSQRSFFKPVVSVGGGDVLQFQKKVFSFFSAQDRTTRQISPENNTIICNASHAVSTYFQQPSYSRQHLSHEIRPLSLKKTKPKCKHK